MTDLEFHDHGTIWLMVPKTDAGERWVAENISSERTEWCAAIVIEHRFIQDIVNGAHHDGLNVARM